MPFTLIETEKHDIYWQITNDDGQFTGMCDNDGDIVYLGNTTWVALSEAKPEIEESMTPPPGWEVYHKSHAGRPDLHEGEYYYQPKDAAANEIWSAGYASYLEALAACQAEADEAENLSQGESTRMATRTWVSHLIDDAIK